MPCPCVLARTDMTYSLSCVSHGRYKTEAAVPGASVLIHGVFPEYRSPDAVNGIRTAATCRLLCPGDILNENGLVLRWRFCVRSYDGRKERQGPLRLRPASATVSLHKFSPASKIWVSRSCRWLHPCLILP